MPRSDLPRFTVFCDETGNSGTRFFSPDQPAYAEGGWFVGRAEGPSRRGQTLHDAFALGRLLHEKKAESGAVESCRERAGFRLSSDNAATMIQAGWGRGGFGYHFARVLARSGASAVCSRPQNPADATRPR
jgi:hypothetical protein